MKHFTLDIHTTTKETLADMWDFMEGKSIVYEKETTYYQE